MVFSLQPAKWPAGVVQPIQKRLLSLSRRLQNLTVISYYPYTLRQAKEWTSIQMAKEYVCTGEEASNVYVAFRLLPRDLVSETPGPKPIWQYKLCQHAS